MKKRHLLGDILLIGGLLLIAAIAAVSLFLFRGEGDCVRVTVDGELYGVYALSQDASVDIHTADGAANNRLIIRDGKAHVDTATCPDGICVAHRAIFRDGESIVCLPNRVVITVVTAQLNDAPDVIA